MLPGSLPVFNRAAVAAPPAGVTLDPAKTSGGITLSGGNLTATWASGFAWALSTVGHSTGKYYAELIVNNLPSPVTLGLGVASASHALGNYIGQDTNSLALYDQHAWYHNGTPTSVGLSLDLALSNGDHCGMEFDAGVPECRWRNWTTGSPWGSTGTVGTLTGAPYFLAVSILASGGQVTMVFDPASWVGTPETGFNNPW